MGHLLHHSCQGWQRCSHTEGSGSMNLEHWRREMMEALRQPKHVVDESIALPMIERAIRNASQSSEQADPQGTKRRQTYEEFSEKLKAVSSLMHTIGSDPYLRFPMGEAGEDAWHYEAPG